MELRVEVTGTCWVWNGATLAKGKWPYGYMTLDKKNWLVHRLMYRIFKGKLHAGKVLDHICRNPRCINPAHLEEVTNKENLNRGETFGAANLKKTHCPSGHPYEGHNLMLEKVSYGIKRKCRKCHQARTIIGNRRRRLANASRRHAP